MVIARKVMGAGLNYGELNLKQIRLFLALMQNLEREVLPAKVELTKILTNVDSAEKGHTGIYLYTEGVDNVLAQFRELRKTMQQTLQQFPEFEANLRKATH